MPVKVIDQPVQKRQSAQEHKSQPVKSWNANQVNAWFAEHKIDSKIVKHFTPCEGEDLLQFYKLQLHSPEFYYQIANHIDGMTDARSFSRFNIALKKLFE